MKLKVIFLGVAMSLGGVAIADEALVECEHDNEFFSMDLVRNVQQRLYAVTRLKAPVGILLRWGKMTGGKQTATRLVDKAVSDSLEHQEVKECMDALQKTNSMAPFYKLWTSCLAYKYLDSDVFMRELITVILMLYKNVLINNLKSEDRDELMMRADSYLSRYCGKRAHDDESAQEAQELLVDMQRLIFKSEIQLTELYHHYGDAMMDPFVHRDGISNMHGQTSNIKDNFSVIMHLMDESNDISDFVIDNNVRFYLIHRMLKSLYLLSKTVTGDYQIMQCCQFSECLHEDFFHHPYVHACAIQIKEQNSLKPIFAIWDHMVSYDFIEDDLFMKDFIGLVMYVCQYLCIPVEHETRSAAALHEMLEMYEKIESLPLAELLDLLDTVVDQFGDVVEQYELNSKMRWSDWLVKYWWAPPVISGTLVYTIVTSKFFQKALAYYNARVAKTA